MNNYETKYMKVVSKIKKEIDDGILKQGQKIYSENELCKKWDVSRQTIRKAFSILESDKYIQRRQGSGTYVLKKPSQIRKKMMTIGLLEAYLDSYIFPEQTAGIEQVLSANGYSLQLSIHHNRFENEASALNSMLSLGVDGLLAEPAKTGFESLNQDLYEEFIKRDIPVVLMNTFRKDSSFPIVSLDDRKGGQMLGEYAISLGHTKIAGVFKTDDHQGQLRLAGFMDAMKQHNLVNNEQRLFLYHTEIFSNLFSSYYEQMALDIISDSTAVICYNDEIAAALLDLFNSRNIRVPEDISILGYDNSDLSRLSDPPMTTVQHPGGLLGKIAANKLLMMINGGEQSSHFFKPELIKRKSVLDIRQ